MSTSKSLVCQKTSGNRPKSPSESQNADSTPKVVEKVKRRRVRTGCLTCRERHLKCDEATPTCHKCLTSRRVCRRGIKLNFIEIKVNSPKVLVPQNYGDPFSICDESRTIASEYEGGVSSYPVIPYDQAVSNPQEPLTSSCFHMCYSGFSSLLTPSVLRFVESHFTQHGITLAGSHHSGPNKFHDRDVKMQAVPNFISLDISRGPPTVLHPIPSRFPSVASIQNLHNANASRSSDGSGVKKTVPSVITDSYLLTFIRYYSKHLATCLDCLVPVPVFQRIIPTIALTQPALLNAIAACGAYSYSKAYPHEIGPEAALRYYSEANRLLVECLGHRPRNLETCTLVSLFLIIYRALQGITFDLRSHIVGIQSLLQEYSLKKNPKTAPLDSSSTISQACLWITLHLDLCISFALGDIPLFNPQQWDPTLDSLKQSGATYVTHYWYHTITHYICRILYLNAMGYDPSKPSTPTSLALRCLMDEIKQWHSDLPTIMRPLYDLAQVNKPFPNIFFTNPVCTIAHVFYHWAMIRLLSDYTTSSPSTTYLNHSSHHGISSGTSNDCNYHALRICGMVTTSDNFAVGTVTVWCLLDASRYIYHGSERRAIIAHLEKMVKSGWINEIIITSVLDIWGEIKWEQ